jgi:hypothetical protein
MSKTNTAPETARIGDNGGPALEATAEGSLSPAAAAIRAKIMEGRASIPDFAKGVSIAN